MPEVGNAIQSTDSGQSPMTPSSQLPWKPWHHVVTLRDDLRTGELARDLCDIQATARSKLCCNRVAASRDSVTGTNQVEG